MLLTCPYFSPKKKTVDATLNPETTLCPNEQRLGLSGESAGETLHVALKGTTVAEELDVSTIDEELASSLLLEVLLAAKRGETPVLGDDDLLATGELVLRAAEGLKGESLVCRVG